MNRNFTFVLQLVSYLPVPTRATTMENIPYPTFPYLSEIDSAAHLTLSTTCILKL